jgi:hypothetical protein
MVKETIMSTKATNFKNNKKRHVKRTKPATHKPAPLNKAERFILKAVRDNDVFKGKDLYIRVTRDVGKHLGNNKRFPPEYERCLKKLAAMLKL